MASSSFLVFALQRPDYKIVQRPQAGYPRKAKDETHTTGSYTQLLGSVWSVNAAWHRPQFLAAVEGLEFDDEISVPNLDITERISVRNSSGTILQNLNKITSP